MSDNVQKTIVIFGSSQPESDSQEYQLAYQIGEILGKNGYIIANGGYGGTMEASAKGGKSVAGRTIGVTCAAFGRKGPNQWIDKEIRTANLGERLEKLIELGEAYVILPGGTGTLLEIAMVWELMNKHVLPPRPMIFLLNYWQGLIKMMKKCDNSTENMIHSVQKPDKIAVILKGVWGS